MRVAITGATGLIGSALCRRLMEEGHEVVLLVRHPGKAQQSFATAQAVKWEATEGPPPAEVLEGVDAVVNLAGESIAAGRWTAQRKEGIRQSRVLGTRHLVQALAACRSRPHVLVSASGIGYYGDRGSEPLDEATGSGGDFLAGVCRQWEGEAQRATELGMRVALLRTGLVLSTRGGALPRMLPPFKAFVGGWLGSGRQWMSWIHIDDEVGAIRQAIDQESIQGPLNATAPNPVTNREFSRELGRVLGRPALMPVPAFILRLLMGEMAQALLLQGQRVLPRKLEASGYHFRFTELRPALQNLLS